MNDRLAHRGKDGTGVWFDGSVALGHQMLHTTQESLHEKLPFKDENSGMIITADARIDNRAELAPLLNLEDSKNVPDSAFILKAYKMWGEQCPKELLGDFAFAIWDPKRSSSSVPVTIWVLNRFTTIYQMRLSSLQLRSRHCFVYPTSP